jgi:hypothetical protein
MNFRNIAYHLRAVISCCSIHARGGSLLTKTWRMRTYFENGGPATEIVNVACFSGGE